MIRLFEKMINPTAAPQHPVPPAKLIPFYWHFAKQAKGLFVLLFVIELFVALLDTAVP
jgi:ATP-binding cassette subfamily B multidrug efflux pump